MMSWRTALMSKNNWIPSFCGRDEELNWLAAQWEAVKAGKPQIAVLLGDTGRGKTRIVQQFYHDLSMNEDPVGYWPDVLPVARSLELNPDDAAFAHRRSDEIPWLWWGVRFEEPDKRNRMNTNATLGSLSILDQHLQPVMERRSLAKNRHKLGLDVAKELMGLIPVLGIVVAGAGFLALGAELFKIKQKQGSTEQQTVVVHSAEQAIELQEKILTLLSMALDRRQTDAPTVPVVLVLDDAQWMDPFSIEFLGRLLARACKHSWPLLVVATHWQREYHHNTPGNPNDLTQIESFAEMVKIMEVKIGAALAERVVEPLKEDSQADKALTDSLAGVLPGLTVQQRQSLLDSAAGNLRLLVECVRTLRSRNRRVFVDGNECNALTEQGEALLADLVQKTDVYDVVMERFVNLGTVTEALMAGSVQGERFLPRVLRAIAADALPNEADPESCIEAALRQADTPESLIEHEMGVNWFVESLYFRVARDYLEEDPKSAERLRRAMKRVLVNEMRTRVFLDTSIVEQMHFLRMAESTLSPDVVEGTADVEGRASWLLAALALVSIADEIGIFNTYVQNLVLRINDIADADELTTVAASDPVVLWWIISSIDLLRQLGRFESSLNVLDALIRSMQLQARSIDADRCEILLELVKMVGQVRLQEGTIEGITAAEEHFENSISLARRIIEEFGETPDRLRKISQVMDLQGDLLLSLEKYSAEGVVEGLGYFEESLMLRRRIIEEFGETPDRLRNVSISLYKLGDVRMQRFYKLGDLRTQRFYKVGDVRMREVDAKDVAAANEYFEESLLIARRIIEEFGETPDHLSDVSMPLNKLGDLRMREETAKGLVEGLGYFEESLMLDRRIIEELGETPIRLNNVTNTLDLLGGVCYHEGTADGVATGLEHLEESLMLRRRIIEEFGETPDRLRSITVSLYKIILMAKDNRSRVCLLAHEGLEITTKLNKELKIFDPGNNELQTWFRQALDENNCDDS
jgi:hypothetical protein